MKSDESQSPKYKPANRSHSPKLATLLSIIPGFGQLYNRRFVKGSIIFTLFLAFILVFNDFLNIGYWGLFTLGTMPGVDDSRVLLAQGVLALILTSFALTFYVANLVDAHKDAQKIQDGWKITSMFEAFRNAWDKGFPYLLIGPGLFLLVFVVIFPLLFMFFLAFTNYTLMNSPPRNLLDWIGFSNFASLLTVPIWRNTFFSVLSWTLVWTLVATTLQISLAMYLAIIVNDKRVKFKKLIRTVFFQFTVAFRSQGKK